MVFPRTTLLVDLHVARIVVVVAVVLNRCRNVVALSNRVGGISLAAIYNLRPVVVLDPVTLTARIILDVDPLIVCIDTAHDPVDLSRLWLLLRIAAEAAEYVAQGTVAGADHNKRPGQGENSHDSLNASHVLLRIMSDRSNSNDGAVTGDGTWERRSLRPDYKIRVRKGDALAELATMRSLWDSNSRLVCAARRGVS
jgi:hypothetical protein